MKDLAKQLTVAPIKLSGAIPLPITVIVAQRQRITVLMLQRSCFTRNLDALTSVQASPKAKAPTISSGGVYFRFLLYFLYFLAVGSTLKEALPPPIELACGSRL